MPDLVHARRDIWITRGHLMALGTATFFIALLAYFIGIEVGRSQADAPEVTADAALLPDANRQDALEALLREVETAQAEAPPMAFNETLAMDNAPEPPVETVAESNSPTEIPTAPTPAPPPAAPEDAPIPKTGWSIQVASYDSESDANSRVAQLKAQGLKSYRVGALIKGRQWFRVRVGAYPNKKAAETARLRLQGQLGGGLLLAEAP
jgi:DedD protein